MKEMRLIDANAFIEFLHNQTFIDGDDRSLVYKWIEEQPTVEAVPVRHGKWVFRDEDKHLIEEGCIPYNMWCSECGEWSDNDSYGDAYCHNCGAIMDKGDEKND